MSALLVPSALAFAQTFSLPNGIRIAFRRAPGSALFAACLLYRCGVDEEGELPGVRAVAVWAALKRASGQRARVESLGGEVRLDLGPDYVAFRVAAPLGASVDSLLLLSAVASSWEFERADVEWAKGRALHELRARLADPYQFSLLALRRALYGPRGYGLPDWGTEGGIRRATVEGAREFARRRLAPGRAFLGVACDMTPRRLLSLLRATLGLVEGREAAPEPPAPRRADGAFDGLTVREGPGRLARVVVGLPAPSASSPDFPAAMVASALLGGGLGGLAARRLREEMGLAYRVLSVCPPLRGEGFLALYAEVEPLKVEEASSALLDLLAEVRAGNVPPSDLLRARSRALGEVLLPLQSVSELAFRLALFEALGLGPDFVGKLAGAIKGLSPDAVLDAARRATKRSRLLVVMPRPGRRAAFLLGPPARTWTGAGRGVARWGGRGR